MSACHTGKKIKEQKFTEPVFEVTNPLLVRLRREFLLEDLLQGFILEVFPALILTQDELSSSPSDLGST